jgi:ABC-type sugar transport system ATPase subunit
MPAQERHRPAGGALLQVTGLDKRFPGVQALSDVDLAVSAGEVVGLVGENGAGKSTLSKIIAGLYAADDGTIVLDGEERRFASVHDAEAAGIVMIPQELQIAPYLSIAENMFAGALPVTRRVVDRRRLHRETEEQLRFFGVRAEPFAPLSTLTTSEQRLVMIAAGLRKQAKLVILDEPTAALTDEETERLFEHVRALRDRGVAWIHVSHRLDELEQIADRVVAMRDGQVIETFDSPHGRRPEIVRAMIGRDLDALQVQAATHTPREEPILRVAGLTVADPINPAKLRVDDVSFDLHPGEVLGLFGLVGAGRTELARAIFGSWEGDVTGDVSLDGAPWRPTSPRAALRSGLVMLTEDRKSTGILAGQSVNANISAASIDRVRRGLFIDRAAEHQRNLGLARDLGVRPLNLARDVQTLSGGNQQKVLLARWLATGPKVMILDEPTIGLDVGARFELFELISRQAVEGRAVLLISSDLEEILTQADRVLVMYKGRLTAEFGAHPERHDVMLAATGEDGR